MTFTVYSTRQAHDDPRFPCPRSCFPYNSLPFHWVLVKRRVKKLIPKVFFWFFDHMLHNIWATIRSVLHFVLFFLPVILSALAVVVSCINVALNGSQLHHRQQCQHNHQLNYHQRSHHRFSRVEVDLICCTVCGGGGKSNAIEIANVLWSSLQWLLWILACLMFSCFSFFFWSMLLTLQYFFLLFLLFTATKCSYPELHFLWFCCTSISLL